MIQYVKRMGNRYYLIELFKTSNEDGEVMFWWRYSGESSVHQLSEKAYHDLEHNAEGWEVMGYVKS